ncbi:hypothetical protein C4D60_Mb10t18520 [Musa balbisiana]|uniref:60S acidic ribosomal protein P1-like n=1 Tax=Musa balbisiana TaxID=52838 RepID=A0A4S8IY13_MUSBA|nr:hypothetical protein C4D60_Mb10t18520 [Musa balbisiana]
MSAYFDTHLMKVIAAYLLAVLGGNISPTTGDVKVSAPAGGSGGAAAASAAAEPKKEEKVEEKEESDEDMGFSLFD